MTPSRRTRARPKTTRMAPSRARASSQSGFTLIEVLVAMSILLVGVLGVVTLVDGANAVTSRTKAREGGNAIARSVIVEKHGGALTFESEVGRGTTFTIVLPLDGSSQHLAA